MVVAVDLFGRPANYADLADVAREAGLVLVADAAQSLGAALDGRKVGTLADYTATSFFPSKPLGCFGDGGAVFTDDSSRAQIIGSLRSHGKGASKYEPVRVGLNSRLDTLQAAVLLAKLKAFDDELVQRRRIADVYGEALDGVVETPSCPDGVDSAWACYTIRTPNRDAVARACAANDIATALYYPVSLNRMACYASFPVALGGVPVAERLTANVLSLPMHAYLSEDAQARVIATVCGAAG